MYEIGQQVVCVKTHSMGAVKEGEIHTIKDVKLCIKCKSLKLDVGLPNMGKSIQSCSFCKNISNKDGVEWIGYVLFRPIDDLYNTEIANLMEEVNQKQPFEL